LAVGVIGFGCAPTVPEPPAPQPLVTRRDSALDSIARLKGPEWRALHYPAADLHGPFTRPVLADTAADPNDPAAYYRLGDSVRHALPGLADRAFYWATRLDPTFADAYFARWTLLRREFWWREMSDGSIRRIFVVQPNAALATDSLLALAIGYSPFLEGTLDVPRWIVGMNERRAAQDPITAGMRAYGLGDYRKAVAEWAKALRKRPNASMLHIPRAYAWVRLNEADSAIADLSLLVQRLEIVERDSAVAPYFSKDFLYYAIGMLHASKHRFPEARAAFEKSLLENLGFYMAHVRLSGAVMMLHDTTAALTELETAMLIRPDDPLVLVYDGSLLLGRGRVTDAEKQFHAALRADSDYALPHVFLGMAAEARHDTAFARTEYATYLARSARSASERAWATSRLATLGPR
jgi:Tfp pilus assembly protein PilF